MIIAGINYGSILALMTIISHEDYGGKNIPKILGAFMTAGAVGILIYEQVIFVSFYGFFQGGDGHSESSGKWNMKLFLMGLLSSGLAFLFAIIVYTRSRGKDKTQDKVKEFVNF